MIQIVAFVGPSGSGKTTIVRELLKRVPKSRLVLSYTTRSMRPTDLLGEYAYVSEKKFEEMKSRNEFFWTAQHGGVSYGTKIESITDVFKTNSVGFMILVPDKIYNLFKFLDAIRKVNKFLLIFVQTSSERVLRERLAIRGDTQESIDRRLKEAINWEKEALSTMLVSYEFIRNDGDIQEPVQAIMDLMSKYG